MFQIIQPWVHIPGLEAAFFYRFPSPGLVGTSMCLALDDQWTMRGFDTNIYEPYQA